MRRFLALACIALTASVAVLGHLSRPEPTASAQGDKRDEAAAAGAIRWPNTVVAPAPTPTPQAVTKLSADMLYVVEWDKDFFLLASPANLVTMVKEAGPITIRGVFADGNGKVQTKKFKGKNVYVVEAVGTGTVELLAVPSGVTDEATIVRKTLDVDSGAGPRPPPGPGPNPPPGPAPIPLAGFRVLIVYDPATLTDAQDGIIAGKAVRDYLQAKCVVGADGKTKDFWIIQTGSDTASAPKWIGDAVQQRPDRKTFMLISDGAKGYDGPVPASADAALAELKKVGG